MSCRLASWRAGHHFRLISHAPWPQLYDAPPEAEATYSDTLGTGFILWKSVLLDVGRRGASVVPGHYALDAPLL